LVPTLEGVMLPGATIVLAARGEARQSQYEHVPFELKDSVSVASAVAAVQPDLIIHLAAQASVGQSMATAVDTWSINLCGSLALAAAIGQHAPQCALFYVSSAEVYGQSYNDGVATEDTPLRPQSAYSRSKAATEAMLQDALPANSRLIVVRPSNHSGSGQGDQFVVPAFAAQIARIERGLANEIHVGNLDAERDFLDVRDVIAAYVALLAKADDLPSRSVYNIGTGRCVRIVEILDQLRTMTTVETLVTQDPDRMRPSEVRRAEIDATAIREAVGWEPTHSLQDMLTVVLSEQRGLIS
jgi:GDP-4-dehydro-6-deoxy-D-mannose reductase